MPHIKSYKIFESTVDKIGDLQLSISEIRVLFNVVGRYIKDVYGDFGWEYGTFQDLYIPGYGIVDSQYIDLLINNRTVLLRVSQNYNLKSGDQLIEFVKTNLPLIYNYNSDFFSIYTLPIVMNSKKKGNIGESMTIAAFKSAVESKGHKIDIIHPTFDQDRKGIDCLFRYENKIYTIQVKPMVDFQISPEFVEIEFLGTLNFDHGIKPDYLFFYKDEEFLFLKNRNLVINLNKIKSPYKNLLFVS